LIEIRGAVELPARREDIGLKTADGLTLVGELALPPDREPVATLLTLHPLPTAGGFMDSHVLKKAAGRLPALAGIGVLRFNFRGTTSPRGTSEGAFGDGVTEALDLRAALDFLQERGLGRIWLLGWSFGTEVLLKHGLEPALDGEIAGAILLSPPLRRTTDAELARWAAVDIPVTALVPEHDDFLQPKEATERFAIAPTIEVVGVEGAKHLWIGERYVSRVLDEIVSRIVPGAAPLPREWRE